MLETLYSEETTTLDQIFDPLGKLVRSTLSRSSQLLIDRLQRWGVGKAPQDYIETAWTISVYSGALSHRIPYRVI